MRYLEGNTPKCFAARFYPEACWRSLQGSPHCQTPIYK